MTLYQRRGKPQDYHLLHSSQANFFRPSKPHHNRLHKEIIRIINSTVVTVHNQHNRRLPLLFRKPTNLLVSKLSSLRLNNISMMVMLPKPRRSPNPTSKPTLKLAHFLLLQAITRTIPLIVNALLTRAITATLLSKGSRVSRKQVLLSHELGALSVLVSAINHRNMRQAKHSNRRLVLDKVLMPRRVGTAHQTRLFQRNTSQTHLNHLTRCNNSPKDRLGDKALTHMANRTILITTII